ncbi:MAG: DUF3604 domain-containing protein [Pseudomonadales bacterium]|nr:DUF3604 domain-containing protein [Pseudomonadales bacterium]NIX08019.1 DUF3604 domain-containing protein [Pseudomonadales bacterium]
MRAPRSTALCLLVLLALPAFAQPTTDYLTPDLRARVEKLKADVAQLPTNTTNVSERSRLLWDWANAFSLDGGVLPVNLTQAVSFVFAYPDLMEDRHDIIDGFIQEMTLLDQEPEALGTVAIDSGPFEAASFVTLRQTLTVGSKAIQAGGGILVARHFQPNYGLWQTSDPSADNYLSIDTSAADVSFTTDTTPMIGMHGGFRRPADALVFRVASGTLRPGDTVTLTYGDRSQGSRGFLMADFASDMMPLPLYVAFTGSGRFFSLPIQPVVVIGGPAAGVHAFAPSVVQAGEPFTLAIRAQDRFYNRASNGHPDWLVSLNGEPFREVPASEQPITLLREIEIAAPGVYRFTVASRDGEISGRANPILIKETVGERIFWGDTHGHSGFAEGIGTPDFFMRWARDDARLDFVTHSEHDIWLDDGEWERLRSNARSYTREGEFVAFLGYEWTVRNTHGGHHNVLFRTPGGRNRLAAPFYPSLSKLFAGLRGNAQPRDVLVIPHAHEAGDYRTSDPELEHLVEVMSQHGNFEWFGQAYLQHGHQVGFTAASDNHLSQPGYSAPKNGSLAQRGGLGAVIARARTSDSLFDAMKQARTYATSGERIILEFSVNGTTMGQRGPFAGSRAVTGRVIGTAPIDSISVLRNGEEIWQRDFLTDTANVPGSSDAFLLTFASVSNPRQPGDNPRGWRHWRGTIKVSDAKLISATGMDFHNQLLQRIEVDAEDPSLLRFSTITRGDTSSIRLELDDASRATEVTISLEPSTETGAAPATYGGHQQLPGAQVTLEMRDFEEGATAAQLPAGQQADTIRLRRIISEGTLEASFAFDDVSERQGDYYYVRVRQADDGLAWSSPVWIGGHAPH